MYPFFSMRVNAEYNVVSLIIYFPRNRPNLFRNLIAIRRILLKEIQNDRIIVSANDITADQISASSPSYHDCRSTSVVDRAYHNYYDRSSNILHRPFTK